MIIKITISNIDNNRDTRTNTPEITRHYQGNDRQIIESLQLFLDVWVA